MVTLYIPNVHIPTELGWVHEATSYYLGTDPSLDRASIVKKSENNTTKLRSITFDYDPIPDITYYHKALVICNKGIIETNVNVLHVDDKISITKKNPIPSAVMTPTITLPNFESVSNSMFTVGTSDINTTSNAKHEYSSYIIEKLNGEAVISMLYDNDNLTERLFDDVILEENTPYVLKVAHHASSGDMSPFAVQPFTTKDTRLINLTTNLDVDKELGMNVIISPITNFKHMRVQLYAAGLGNAKKVYDYTVYSLTKVIDPQYFSSDTNKFILALTVTLTDNKVIGPKHYEITTIN